MSLPTHATSPLPHARLPTELNIIIIQRLSRKDLLQAARVCRNFHLEAEARIYDTIDLLPDELYEKRFRALKQALLSQPRRQALARTIGSELKIVINEQIVKFWWEALSELLPILPNLKSLHLAALDAPRGIDTTFLCHLPSRLEKLRIQAVMPSTNRLNDLLELQPDVRTLYISHSRMAPISSHLLTRLEVVVGACEVISLCAPGRPVKRVRIFSITKHSKLY